MAAGGALLAATAFFLMAQASAAISASSLIGWGVWTGALGGLLVWFWFARWMWMRVNPRWAAILAFGNFVGLGVYVFKQNHRIHGRTEERMPGFPTALLCGSLVAVSVATILVSRADTGGTFIRIDGSGMEPGLANGEYLVFESSNDGGEAPQRGAIVMYENEDSGESQVKRVIGLPGERVVLENGGVEVDGMPLREPYVEDRVTSCGVADECQVLVPPRHVYVLGDNRSNSLDSRSFGAVSVERIVGEARFSVWPPSRFGPVPSPEYAAS
jgi:signal peptidase I